MYGQHTSQLRTAKKYGRRECAFTTKGPQPLGKLLSGLERHCHTQCCLGAVSLRTSSLLHQSQDLQTKTNNTTNSCRGPAPTHHLTAFYRTWGLRWSHTRMFRPTTPRPVSQQRPRTPISGCTWIHQAHRRPCRGVIAASKQLGCKEPGPMRPAAM